MTTHIVLKQTRSGIGRPESQKLTLVGLGLKGPNSTSILQDTPAIRGMIVKVQHLVDVKVFAGAPPSGGQRTRKRG